MKKAVLIPDSFKGTLGSSQICEMMEERIKEHFPECEVVSIPVADGGEGSVDCFVTALHGEKVKTRVKGPFFEDMECFYGLVEQGRTAIIEMAACAGLPLVEGRRNPMLTTTYGVGQLMLHAVRRGCKKIIVGLGGSCTNDAGAGAAAAIGVKFFNKQGEVFIPTGGTLKDVDRIDVSSRDKELEGIEIITMCDIDNPMYGEQGAAYIFGPQKGADEQMLHSLDTGVRHISDVMLRDLAVDVKSLPGGGAAGAMGAGMVAFFQSRLQMGIETVLDTVNFDAVITDADMIFTGEGRMDAQSLRGKVVIGVAKRAKEKQVPVTVLAGGAEADICQAYDLGVTSVFTINRLPEDFSISRWKSEQNLVLTMDNILRLIKSAGR